MRKIIAEMAKTGSTLPFDILYVVDTKRSWYTHEECLNSSRSSNEDTDLTADNSQEQIGLGSYYRSELEVALKPYKHVIMLGDSMGASATLLFSPLATSIIAFCPQVRFGLPAQCASLLWVSNLVTCPLIAWYGVVL